MERLSRNILIYVLSHRELLWGLERDGLSVTIEKEIALMLEDLGDVTI